MNHFVVMGVTSCGKSTIATLLAERLIATGQDATMIEADDLHGKANVEKMQRGEPLTDEDRWPWLVRVSQAIKESSAPVFVSCSALRRDYRQFLQDNAEVSIGFIHLHTNVEVLRKRMAGREGHFMPLSLLDSQIQTLEPLESDESGVVVDIDKPIDQVVDDAMRFVRVSSVNGARKPSH